MQVKIEYCAPCGYLPQATSLASEIKNKYGVDAELVKGVKGIFDVYVDGTAAGPGAAVTGTHSRSASA
jgi:selT/selW/selH-like putative selenoprotein